MYVDRSFCFSFSHQASKSSKPAECERAGSLSGPKSAPSFPPATPPPPSRMEQSPASEAVRMAHAHTSIHYPELPPPQQQQQQQQQADADPNPPNFFQRFN